MMLGRAIRFLAVGCMTSVLTSVPAPPARAGGQTLKRAVENLAQAPAELLVGPVVAGQTLHRNMQADGYTVAEQVVFSLPGFVWLGGAQFGMAAGRAVGGALELPLGLGFLFSKKEPSPLISIDTESALVDHPTKHFHIKFGIYTAGRH
jgi:hypothetical protein